MASVGHETNFPPCQTVFIYVASLYPFMLPAFVLYIGTDAAKNSATVHSREVKSGTRVHGFQQLVAQDRLASVDWQL